MVLAAILRATNDRTALLNSRELHHFVKILHEVCTSFQIDIGNPFRRLQVYMCTVFLYSEL